MNYIIKINKTPINDQRTHPVIKIQFDSPSGNTKYRQSFKLWPNIVRLSVVFENRNHHQVSFSADASSSFCNGEPVLNP